MNVLSWMNVHHYLTWSVHTVYSHSSSTCMAVVRVWHKCLGVYWMVGCTGASRTRMRWWSTTRCGWRTYSVPKSAHLYIHPWFDLDSYWVFTISLTCGFSYDSILQRELVDRRIARSRYSVNKEDIEVMEVPLSALDWLCAMQYSQLEALTTNAFPYNS